MLLLRTLAPWLLLAFLGPQVSLSSAAHNKTRGADKTVIPAAGRALRSGTKGVVSGRGKFSIKDQMQCTWGARDVRDAVALTVKCENPKARVEGGVTDLKCEYTAKPQGCPGYGSDPKGFWKQVGRALKRLQGKVCKEDRALVKAAMCKRAPRDAHFKLDLSSSVVSAQSGEPETPRPPPRSTSAGPTACTRRAAQRETAEEYCSSSWASVCAFFFSMLQGDDC